MTISTLSKRSSSHNKRPAASRLLKFSTSKDVAKPEKQPPNLLLGLCLGAASVIAAGAALKFGTRFYTDVRIKKALKKAFMETQAGKTLLEGVPHFNFPKIKLWDRNGYSTSQNIVVVNRGNMGLKSKDADFLKGLNDFSHEMFHAGHFQMIRKRNSSLAEERGAQTFAENVTRQYQRGDKFNLEDSHNALKGAKRWMKATQKSYENEGLQNEFPMSTRDKSHAFIHRLTHNGVFTKEQADWIKTGR